MIIIINKVEPIVKQQKLQLFMNIVTAYDEGAIFLSDTKNGIIILNGLTAVNQTAS